MTAIPRTATASRARDPQFDSAIIGNSTAQLLNPAELSRSTGLRFVQLYRDRADPRESSLRCWISSCGIIARRRAGVRRGSVLVRA